MVLIKNSNSDINECSTNNGGCDTNAECTNTAGGRNCQCKTGYNGDGFTCSGELVVGFKLNFYHSNSNIEHRHII